MANYAHYVLESLSKNPQKKCLVSIRVLHARRPMWYSSNSIYAQVLGKEEIRCEEFHKRVTAYAKLLRAKGVRPNDHLLMTILPSVDFFALAVAAFAVG